MGRLIVRLEPEELSENWPIDEASGELRAERATESAEDVPLYMEWSTVVDAPVTSLMSLEKFREWYNWRYPDDANLAERLNRVEEYGTSSVNGTIPEELLAHNRAGPNETHLTAAEIIGQYRETGN